MSRVALDKAANAGEDRADMWTEVHSPTLIVRYRIGGGIYQRELRTCYTSLATV